MSKAESRDNQEPPKYERKNVSKWSMEKLAKRIRSFVRDFVVKNKLDMGEIEHEWGDIYDGIEDAFMDWNASPPTTTDTLKTIDKRAIPLLVRRVAAYLLQSAAQEQARNQIRYNDQGFGVTEDDKAQMYLTMSQELEGSYYEGEWDT